MSGPAELCRAGLDKVLENSCGSPAEPQKSEAKGGFVALKRGTGFARAETAGVRTWWPQEVTASLQEGGMVWV